MTQEKRKKKSPPPSSLTLRQSSGLKARLPDEACRACSPDKRRRVEGSTGLFIVTLGPIGYLPASGTCATVATMGMIAVVHMMHVAWFVYGLVLVICLLGGLYAIQQTHKHFVSRDPREIVIDEAVGCLCTFLFVPWTWRTALLGFLLFRFFDVTKTCGIRFLERPAGAWGIMLDDIGAGIISNLLIHAALWFGFNG